MRPPKRWNWCWTICFPTVTQAQTGWNTVQMKAICLPGTQSMADFRLRVRNTAWEKKNGHRYKQVSLRKACMRQVGRAILFRFPQMSIFPIPAPDPNTSLDQKARWAAPGKNSIPGPISKTSGANLSRRAPTPPGRWTFPPRTRMAAGSGAPPPPQWALRPSRTRRWRTSRTWSCGGSYPITESPTRHPLTGPSRPLRKKPMPARWKNSGARSARAWCQRTSPPWASSF